MIGLCSCRFNYAEQLHFSDILFDKKEKRYGMEPIRALDHLQVLMNIPASVTSVSGTFSDVFFEHVIRGAFYS